MDVVADGATPSFWAGAIGLGQFSEVWDDPVPVAETVAIAVAETVAVAAFFFAVASSKLSLGHLTTHSIIFCCGRLAFFFFFFLLRFLLVLVTSSIPPSSSAEAYLK